MGFPRINSFLRGLFRIGLAALFGVLIALPLRFFLAPSTQSPEPQATQSAKGEVKAEPARPADVVAGDKRPLGSPSNPAPVEPPFPTGYVARGKRVTVAMSDGTTRIERYQISGMRRGELLTFGEVTDVQRNSIVIDGERIFIKPAPSPQNMVSPGIDKINNQSGNDLGYASPGIDQAKAPDPSGWVQGPDGVWRSTKPSLGVGR